MDGIVWQTLREHRNDAQLSARGIPQVWKLDRVGDTYYSMFRITMTGPNSSHRFGLACGGIELFGDAFVDFPVEPQLCSSPPSSLDENLRVQLRRSLSVWLDGDALECPLHEIDGRKPSFTAARPKVDGLYCGVDVSIQMIPLESCSTTSKAEFLDLLGRLR